MKIDPESELESLAGEIDSYLRHRFSYKAKLARVRYGRITARRKQCDIYLRYKEEHRFWPASTLVVARLHFHQTRVGNGSDFLQFLVDIAEGYSYERIGLEQTNPDASDFAERLGFKKFKERDREWTCPIPELQRTFDQRARRARLKFA